MPISFAIADASLGLLYRVQGRITAEEMFEHQRRVEPHMAAARYILVDSAEVEEVAMSRSDIERLALEDLRRAALYPGMVVAIVGQSDITFGMARMYESTAEHTRWRLRVFRDLDSARDWIRAGLRDEGIDGLSFA